MEPGGQIPMRCAIYSRVSTRDRGQDCENQLAQIRAWASANGHTVVSEYSDCVSGSGKVRRPAFEAMMNAARDGCACERIIGKDETCSECGGNGPAFQILLFWSLDRFSRSGVLGTLKMLEQLDDAGVSWRSHTEPYLDSCGVFRDAILAILAAIAKQERLRISERVKAGLDIAAAKGRYPGRPPTEKHDPVKMAEVFRLRKHGRSIRGIARDIGISKTTVQRLVKDAASVTQ